MTRVYYKATRPDGTSFHRNPDGTHLRWEVGKITAHPYPLPTLSADAVNYLSVSSTPTDCTGMHWPCRLFLVTPVDGVRVWQPHRWVLPSKYASLQWRVLEETPAHRALGPQGEEVIAALDRLATAPSGMLEWFTPAVAFFRDRAPAETPTWQPEWPFLEARRKAHAHLRTRALGVADHLQRRAAVDAVCEAARFAVSRDRLDSTAVIAISGALIALVLRDALRHTPLDRRVPPGAALYDTLVYPWARVLGPIHPADPSKKK